MKNYNDTIENRTHNLPACIVAPQPSGSSSSSSSSSSSVLLSVTINLPQTVLFVIPDNSYACRNMFTKY